MKGQERLMTTGVYKTRLELEEAVTNMEGSHKDIGIKTGVSACTVSRIKAGKDMVSPPKLASRRLDSVWKIPKNVDNE